MVGHNQDVKLMFIGTNFEVKNGIGYSVAIVIENLEFLWG